MSKTARTFYEWEAPRLGRPNVICLRRHACDNTPIVIRSGNKCDARECLS
jgi:hypothetical protein